MLTRPNNLEEFLSMVDDYLSSITDSLEEEYRYTDSGHFDSKFGSCDSILSHVKSQFFNIDPTRGVKVEEQMFLHETIDNIVTLLILARILQPNDEYQNGETLPLDNSKDKEEPPSATKRTVRRRR